jgi:hypothetical protein
VPVSRAYWKGYLKLSFVSCPIALYPAISAAERLSFRQVNRRTGHRLKHKLVDSVTGEAVDFFNKARGYEVGENEFLLVEDRDLERARSDRPPPGAVELAEPPRRESPRTVPAKLYEQDEEADGDDESEEEEAAPFPRQQNTRTIEIERVNRQSLELQTRDRFPKFAWTNVAPFGSKFCKDIEGNQMNLAKVEKARTTSGQVSMANVWARVRITLYAQSLNQVDAISQRLTEMVTRVRCDGDPSPLMAFDHSGRPPRVLDP